MIRNNTCDEKKICLTYIHIDGNKMVIKWCRCNKSSEKYSKYANKRFSREIASINTAGQTAWANNVYNICFDVFSAYYNIFLCLRYKLRHERFITYHIYAFALLYLFWWVNYIEFYLQLPSTNHQRKRINIHAILHV